MKVILQKSVPKVGKKDEVVDVAEGYARNALFPAKAAILATPEALAELKRKKNNQIAEKALRHQLLDTAIKAMSGKSITLTVRANEKGSIFSRVDEADIARFLADEYRIVLDESCIVLPHGPIKELGEYKIVVKDEDFASTFLLTVAQKNK